MSAKENDEEFEPYCKWQTDGRNDEVLKVYLNGFMKDKLEVVVGKDKLTVSGRRPLDKYTKQRFKRTFPVPKNCKKESISNKFTDGILSITFPKNTTDSSTAIASITQWCLSDMAWKIVERVAIVGFGACVFKCCTCFCA